jgi:electron transfer flavoprotein alpha subunit
MNIADYKGGVWVFAEQRDGELQKVSLELLGKGKEVAEKLNTKLVAVLLGSETDELAKTLVAYGADKVLVADSKLLGHYTTDAYAKVISELINEKKPEVVLIGATFIGRDLGPRLAAKLSTGLTADCTALDTDPENGNLLATRPAFGGNLMATIVCAEHRPQMATVRPGVFAKLEKDVSKIDSSKIEKISFNLVEDDIRTKVQKVVKLAKQVEDISEANIIVAGGRGVGTKENFELLNQLARVLGGSIGASRAAIEKEWVDKDLQVGQTGKTVRPGLYIACGISGALQHLAGMEESDYIIAINKDESAPMMKLADLAIVGDLTKVIPELISQIKVSKDK